MANVASHMTTFEISSETEYLLPVLLLVRVDARHAQHQPLDRHEDRIEERAAAGEHLEHVPAEQHARGDREQDGDGDGDVFGAHALPQNFSGRSIAYTRYTKAATLKTRTAESWLSPTHGRTA